MGEYSVRIDSKKTPLAWKLYDALVNKAGVKPDALDFGYNVTNFDGSSCSQTEPSCIIGASDHYIDAAEVFEYALNHYNDHRAVVRGVLGRPVPWQLDELGPETPNNEKTLQTAAMARRRIADAIAFLRDSLKTQGLQENSDAYKTKMAIGLYCLVALPGKKHLEHSRPVFDALGAELEKEGLGSFKDYLWANGGLRPMGARDRTVEHAALDAIVNDTGKCTEQSKILFSVYRQAGFEPSFVEVDVWKSTYPDVQITLNEEWNVGHVCVGLKLGNRMRLFDPTLFSSDAAVYHKSYRALSLRQYLSVDYVDRGLTLSKRHRPGTELLETYEHAMELDPENPGAHQNRCGAYAVIDELDKAATACTRAIEINPANYIPFVVRGFVFAKKGDFDRTISDASRAIELAPNCAQARILRGNAYAEKGELEKALFDFSEAASLSPKDASIYKFRTGVFVKKGDPDKAADDILKAMQINPKDEELRLLARVVADALCARGEERLLSDQQTPLASADAELALRLSPDSAMAYNLLCLVQLKKGDVDSAERSARRSIEGDPQYAAAHCNLGLIHAHKSDVQGSIDAFKRGIDLKPSLAPKVIHDLGAQSSIVGSFILIGLVDRLGKADDAAHRLETLAQQLSEIDTLPSEATAFIVEQWGRLPEHLKKTPGGRAVRVWIETHWKQP